MQRRRCDNAINGSGARKYPCVRMSAANSSERNSPGADRTVPATEIMAAKRYIRSVRIGMKFTRRSRQCRKRQAFHAWRDPALAGLRKYDDHRKVTRLGANRRGKARRNLFRAIGSDRTGAMEVGKIGRAESGDVDRGTYTTQRNVCAPRTGSRFTNSPAPSVAFRPSAAVAENTNTKLNANVVRRASAIHIETILCRCRAVGTSRMKTGSRVSSILCSNGFCNTKRSRA